MTRKFTRRDFALMSANIGIASFAATALPRGLAAQDMATAKLGHFSSANQQNFSMATGSMQAAMGDGVTVEYVGITAGPQILTAMASEEMDICNIGSSPMIVGFAKGLPISMIYIHKIIKESEALCVKPDSGIETMADLKGKRIGCPFNTTVHFALLAGMKKAGLGPSDATLINLKPDSIAAAWDSGSIDAAYIWYPVLQILEESGGKTIFSGTDLIEDGTFVFDGIVVRDGFKEEHPDLVLAYLKELDRINGIYRDNPDEMANVMADFLQIPRETAMIYAENTHTLSPQEQLTDTWMGEPGATDTGALNTIKQQAAFLQEAGQVTSMPDDFSQFVDSSFLQQMV
jgi:taurine transport system substrate-binding protein